MPTVPRLTAPQVGTRPLPTPGVSPAAEAPFAGALGQVAQGLADVSAIYQRERQRVDEIRVNEADVQLRAVQQRLLYDPKTGVLQQRGLKAQAAGDGVASAWQKAVDAIEAGLSTAEQRALFRRRAQQVGVDLSARVMAHTGAELRRVDEETHRTLLAQEYEAVGAAAVDEQSGEVSTIVNRIRERVALYGDRNGMAPEAIQDAVTRATSEARVLQIQTLVKAGRVDEARLAAVEWSDQLTPADREAIQGPLAEAAQRSVVTRAAARILAEANGSAQAAYEMVREIADLDQRAAVRKYVEAEFAAADEARRRDEDTRYVAATNLVDANPGRLPREVIDPVEWNRLTLPQREALERRASTPVNNDKRWLEFWRMDPPALAKLTQAEFETRYWSTFDPAHRSRAEAMYREAKQDPTGASPKTYALITDRERVTNTLAGMRLVSSPLAKNWTEEDARVAAGFEQEAEVRIQAFEAAKGKPATPVEKQQIITALGWEQAPRNGRGVIGYDAIPVADANAIAAEMSANGQAVTKRAVEDAYAAKLNGNEPRYRALTTGRVFFDFRVTEPTPVPRP